MPDHDSFSRPGLGTLRYVSTTTALFGAAAPAMAASKTDLASIMLPTSFIGEAATLALAFAAPALCAGGYLLLKRVIKALGVPAAIGVGVATAAGGIALAIGADPQLLTRFAGL